MLIAHPVEHDLQLLTRHRYLLQHAAVQAVLHKYVAEHRWHASSLQHHRRHHAAGRSVLALL